MAKVIYKNNFEELLLELKKNFKVIAPIEKHPRSSSKVIFDEFEKNDKLVLDYPVTVLPPKEFLLPPEDTLFEIRDGQPQEPQKQPKTILFGLSYEDLEGIARLRTIFEAPIADEVFRNRSGQMIVIAADHFSPPKKISFDIYLQKVSAEEYIAFSGSAVGQKILKNKLFKTKNLKAPRVLKKQDGLINNKILGLALEKSKNHSIWDELEKECFACGICSYVCPLCYCFETTDETSLPKTKDISGRRVRKWSTCFSEDFARTAGYNFRPLRKDRIYNWYYHKFVRMPEEYGFSGCVDCNRCVVLCPAKINYRLVLKEVLTDFKDNK